MTIDELKKENRELRQILSLTGLPEEHRIKRIIVHDLLAINTLIMNMINRATLSGLDLKSIGVSEQSTKELTLSIKNIPIAPLFRLNPEAIKTVTSLCADDDTYKHILREQLKFL